MIIYKLKYFALIIVVISCKNNKSSIQERHLKPYNIVNEKSEKYHQKKKIRITELTYYNSNYFNIGIGEFSSLNQLDKDSVYLSIENYDKFKVIGFYNELSKSIFIKSLMDTSLNSDFSKSNFILKEKNSYIREHNSGLLSFSIDAKPFAHMIFIDSIEKKIEFSYDFNGNGNLEKVLMVMY